MSRAFLLGLALVGLVLAGCKGFAKIGEEADSGPRIFLFGYDEDVPKNPPDACKEIERVEVSTMDKEAFPEKDFRKAAESAGGNGVGFMRRAGNEEVFHGTKYMFKGVVVKCPARVLPAPSASASASAAP
ncbi:MAG: hypothetical protein JNL21_32735 [Myxococcales bacterium]|nr:hypothetical protein [Myxococcales bacterium]